MRSQDKYICYATYRGLSQSKPKYMPSEFTAIKLKLPPGHLKKKKKKKNLILCSQSERNGHMVLE